MKAQIRNGFFLLAAMVATGAQAQWAVYDARVETAMKAIVDAVRSSAQTTSSAVVKAAEQNAAAAMDATAANEIAKLDEKYRFPSACDAVAATRGVADAVRTAGGGVGGGGRGGGGARLPSKISQVQADIIRISEGTLPAPSFEVQTSLAVKAGCETYASTTSLRAARCENAGMKPGTAGVFRDADIRSQTLIDGPQEDGKEFRRKLTIDSTSDSMEFAAIRAYQRNLDTPIQLRELTKSEMKTEAGRQFLSFKDSYDARMSMASSPVNTLVANRAANPVLIPVVEQLAKADSSKAYVDNYLKVNFPDWKRKGVSIDELMNLEVERRYMNKDWHMQIASTAGEPIAKEQLIQTAFQNVLLWRMVQTLDKMNLVNGQIAASTVRQEMNPALNQLHSVAAGRR